MCNKQKYTLKEAKTALNECKKNKAKKWRKECRYYLCNCESCKGYYHLTSKENWEEPVILTLEDLKEKQEWLKLMKKGEEN